MAFNGYFLKINGNVFPMKYMVIPSYVPKNEPIITNDYYDAEYKRHISKASNEDISINFNIRSLNNAEYSDMVAFFEDTMTVEYYDPKIDGYLEDVFTCTSNLTPSVMRVYNNQIWYNEHSISLIRKAD